MHRRIAFGIVGKLGGRGVGALIGGFMLAVWLLSMWISNTATILAMLPVAEAFLASLPAGHEQFQSGFLLAIGYAATIGGLATPVGTPTNAIFLSQFALFFPDEPEFSFARFVLTALPLSMMLLLVTWLGVCTVYVWRAPKPIPVDLSVFQRAHVALGWWTYEELVVAIDLGILIVLWFTAREWKPFIAPKLNSGAIGLMLTLPMFFIPCGVQLSPGLKQTVGPARCSSAAAESYDPKPNGVSVPPRCILDWDAVKGKFKREILFIFGGGYMVASGTLDSGLAAEIAHAFASLGTSPIVFLFLVVSIICFITEVVSNMATVAIFGPIIVGAAATQGFSPVVLLLCVTLASSFAFMLPMAGGPNMTVFSTGKLSIQFMAKHGFALNLCTITIGTLYFYTLVPALLGDYTDLRLGRSADTEAAAVDAAALFQATADEWRLNRDCGVATTGGTAAEGSSCKFPFLHEGVTCNECASHVPASPQGTGGSAWCDTDHTSDVADVLPCGTWCEDNLHSADACGCGVCGSYGGCSQISCPTSLGEGESGTTSSGHKLDRCPASAAQAGEPGWGGSSWGKCLNSCEKTYMRRHLFEELGEGYQEAVCQDGTSSGYYYAPATTQQEIFTVMLEGGGWCYDEASCASRCGDQSDDGVCSTRLSTSSVRPSHIWGTGILASDPDLNPIYGAHKAYVMYCTSDAHMGNADASDRTFGWFFKGQAAVKATVTSMVQDHGLGSREGHTLLFGGLSAGGRGAMVNLDYLPALLERLGVAENVRLLSYPDSPYWIDDGCDIDTQTRRP